jgi:hypothetical protein
VVKEAANAEGAPNGAASSAAGAAVRRPEVKVRNEKVQKVVLYKVQNVQLVFLIFILKNAKEKLSIIATEPACSKLFFYRL